MPGAKTPWIVNTVSSYIQNDSEAEHMANFIENNSLE